MVSEIKLKEAKTFDEQLNILEERGVIIDNRESAKKVLSIVNYYRLTAYAIQFKVENKYIGNIRFDTIYDLYNFDKKMKNLIIGTLESIEISIRTYIAYTLAHKYGADSYTKSEIFENEKYHNGLMNEISKEIKRNYKEPFVIHHNDKYNGKFPIWAVIELISFGALSRMYSNLKREDKRIVSRELLGLDYKLLVAGLLHLSYVRNICAHYGRLYNKKFVVFTKLHKNYSQYNIDGNSLFATILSIKELMPNKDEWIMFKIQLEALIEQNKDIVDLNLIGFPDDWRGILDM